MSETVPLEQLLNEKLSVEDEGRELEEEQKQLRNRAKALTEKIILELRKKNNDKQVTVNQLQSTINELENQLKSLTASTVNGKTIEHINGNTITPGAADMLEGEPQTATIDNVSITEVAEQIEVDMDSKDKRKRKFF